MYFRLKDGAGSHAETLANGKVKTYDAAAGEVIDSAVDLEKLFPNKFERVKMSGQAQEPTGEGQEAPEKGQDGEGSKGKGKAPEASPLGRDMTYRFPIAQENEFKVFQDGGAFFVVEEDDPAIVLHDKPLKRQMVEQFIKDYLKG